MIQNKNKKCIVSPNMHGAYLSASATVEAALVIPVFIYAVIAVMYIMQMIAVQLHIQESLYNECRMIAKYAYLKDCIDSSDEYGASAQEPLEAKEQEVMALLNKGFTAAAVQALFIKETGADYASRMHITGGNAGYIMTGSKILDGNNDVVLEVRYIIKNPFDIFGIAVRSFTQKACVTAWLGKDMYSQAHEMSSSHAEEKYVYITDNGSVYHTDKACTYLTVSVKKTDISGIDDIRNKNGGIYYECEYCSRNYESSNQVYITEYGDRYHRNRQCPRISRHIIKIPESSAGGRKKCSKCGM